MRTAIGLVSIGLILLATAFVGYTIWFCAGALTGDLQGCIASAGGAALLSPAVSAALLLGLAGLMLARGRRK